MWSPFPEVTMCYLSMLFFFPPNIISSKHLLGLACREEAGLRQWKGDQTQLQTGNPASLHGCWLPSSFGLFQTLMCCGLQSCHPVLPPEKTLCASSKERFSKIFTKGHWDQCSPWWRELMVWAVSCLYRLTWIEAHTISVLRILCFYYQWAHVYAWNTAAIFRTMDSPIRKQRVWGVEWAPGATQVMAKMWFELKKKKHGLGL